MRILHLMAGSIEEGAARGLYWLHEGLLNKGIDSKILIQQEYRRVQDNTVSVITRSKKTRIINYFNIMMEKLIVHYYRKKNPFELFSPSIFGLNIMNNDLYKNADIIHLHWINNAYIDFKMLSKIQKPIVWTLRDMWPFTGGCHYAGNCENYKNSCGRCPMLGSSSKYDLSKYIFQRKKKYYKDNIHAVAISNWMKTCAQESKLFNNTEVIHNCLDPEKFSSISKKTARETLGLSIDSKVVLIGAINILDNKTKGFDKFIEAVKLLDDDIQYLFFGSHMSDHENFKNKKIKSLGFINDDITLKIVYSAADVFVAPSIQEAFGKMIIESMACETPVVAFDATGPKDIITHKVDGYLAEAYESSDLAEGIKWILEDKEQHVLLSKKAREKVMNNFSSDIIAEKYIDLYKKII
jgi:glycosyltransferase involved in cell wall biosynthesis